MKNIASLLTAISLLMGGYVASTYAAESTKGHYYWGVEVESFIPCGSDNAFWVVGDKKVLLPLRDKVRKLFDKNQQPYSPLYVELTGSFEDNSDSEGFAADYDGLYRIKSVLATSPDSPASCPVIEADD